MKIINARVFDGRHFVDQSSLYINDGCFVASDAYVDDGIEFDAYGKIVAPGLVDLHFHGCMGHDFCDASVESIGVLAAYEASQGITSICPATMTFPEDKLASIMDAARAFAPSDDQAQLVGINMEGPFISPDKVGAQNPLYVQRPDAQMLARLQERSGGLVKLVDVAPEEPGALDFISECSTDVRISLAHMCADYDAACAAFEAGARQMTHLYNAMPGLHHRNPGPIAAAAERDDVTAEIICDGVHIHPAMVRLAFKLFGPERMILISDTMEAAGLDDGEYSLGGQAVTVRGNRATLHDGTIAGSNTNLARCMQIAVCDMGVPIEHALRAATYNPACALGIESQCGAIREGAVADCVVLGEGVDVEQVVLRGKLL